MSSQSNTRDPVCGMTVDPVTAQYTTVHNGTTWYFCAAGCRDEFLENSDHFAGASTTPVQPVAKRTSLGRELRWAVVLFVIIVALVMLARGFTVKKTASAMNSNTVVIGKAAGQDQAVDDGSGGVITTVNHDRQAAAGETVFTLSLNTHTADLNAFDPMKQVHLRDATTELHAQGFAVVGERSSHHQEYRVQFTATQGSATILVVTDLGGVAQRQFPFST